MEITQPAIIANIPSLQTPLISRSGGHNIQNVEISGNARVHLGDVFSLSGSQSQQLKEQPFTVPFSRDDNFIPRGDIVDELMKDFKADKHSRAALYGMGGVGYDVLTLSYPNVNLISCRKTQIAIAFAYAYRDFNPDVAVLWLFAGSSERLQESFVQIATDLNLPGHDDTETDKRRLVFSHLSEFRNGRWLLIIDSMDEFNMPSVDVRGSKATSVAELPQTGGCAILVTTRDERIAQNIAGHWNPPRAVDPMSREDAALLLGAKLPNPSFRTARQDELLTELGLLPLAIAQAGAYMMHFKVNMSKYLD